MSDSNEMLIDEWDDPKSHDIDIEIRIENAVNQWNAHKYAKKKDVVMLITLVEDS